MSIEARKAAFCEFWAGHGPSLLLLPAGSGPQYDTTDYVARFEDPERMWEAEMRRARAIADWPTDGIPAVRPNLGVIFIPGAAGQAYEVRNDTMPWPGEPLTRNEIRALPGRDIESSKMLRLAREFYRVHRARANGEAVAYQPDTQGVFSLAHLFYGDRIFTDLAEDPGWVRELLDLTAGIHARVLSALKSYLGEPATGIFHGHSYPNGVYFPTAGLRISEDTATMVSPRMVREFVLPWTVRTAGPWGGCFVHFCGRHEFLFEQLCRLPEVCAIDLGNPEMYDTAWLMRHCGETGTVLFSPLPALEGEDWRAYAGRLAALSNETGARMILRATVYPGTRDECARMLDLWHELTI